MKNKQLALLLGILLCYLSPALRAQGIYTVNSSNLSATVNDIFATHGTMIDQSYQNVYDFLNNLLLGASSSCPPPSPAIQNMDTNTITFSWPTVPSANLYHLSYLKLNQLSAPNTAAFSTNATQMTITIPNGLTLFAFQSACLSGIKGSVKVIIVDKPAFILPGLNQCNCEVQINEQFAVFSDEGTGLSLGYTHAGELGVYKGSIEYISGQISQFIIGVEYTGEGLHIYSAPNCMLNVDNNSSLMYSIDPTTEEVLATLSFPYGFYLQPVAGNAGVIRISECVSMVGRVKENLSPTTLSVTPNPASEIILIQVPIIPESADLYLLDTHGRTLRSKKLSPSPNTSSLQLNIADLNPGVYHILLETHQEKQQSRFIKIE